MGDLVSLLQLADIPESACVSIRVDGGIRYHQVVADGGVSACAKFASGNPKAVDLRRNLLGLISMNARRLVRRRNPQAVR